MHKIAIWRRRGPAWKTLRQKDRNWTKLWKVIYDNKIILTPKKQFPIGKESFRLQDGDALNMRLRFYVILHERNTPGVSWIVTA